LKITSFKEIEQASRVLSQRISYDDTNPPFSSSIVVVPPGQSTSEHNHHDSELWLLLKGHGRLVSNKKIYDVKQGDAIYFNPLDSHVLTNSSDDSLEFVTIWWEDMSRVEDVLMTLNKKSKKEYEKEALHIVLPSFPTPNGTVHVGHLSGPYIGADIVYRFSKMRRRETRLMLGTIGYQSHVLFKAKQLGLTFYELAEKNSLDIKETLEKVDVTPNIFVTPKTTQYYKTISQNIFTTLYQKGFIKLKNKLSWYCEPCSTFLFEAFITGTCRYCGSKNAGGNECEQCGRFYEDETLLHPTCCSCGSTPGLKELQRPYFDLNQFKETLVLFHKEMNASPKLQAFCTAIMKEELPDIPVTYLTDFGVTVPLEGFEEHKLFSAFELAGRFLTAVKEHSKKEYPKQNWMSKLEDDAFTLSMLFGFDNAYLRAIIFPAVIHAFNPKINLPKNLIVNEFYNLDHEKFSTSRNHVITGKQLAEQFSSDSIRFYLSYTRPEQQSTNFNLDEFKEFMRNVDHTWNEMLGDINHHVQVLFNGVSPEAGVWDKEAEHFYSEILQYQSDIQKFYEPHFFSPQKATRALCSFVEDITLFKNKVNPLVEDIPEFNASLKRTYVSLELMAIKTLAQLTWPVMPQFAETLWSHLGFSQPIYDSISDHLLWVPKDQRINISYMNLDREKISI
jgi:methionyl-tRNA synthetase